MILGVRSQELGVGDRINQITRCGNVRSSARNVRGLERERSESNAGARATSEEYAGVTENSL